MYKLNFAPGWDKYFSKMDKGEKEKILGKIEKIMTLEKARHLKFGSPYYVVESGQHRICYEQKGNTRTIAFAGNHKQYEKWYKKQ
ncbi:MAG: hypothetical protein COV47_05390 [Candidatus Diapherotrites archaeon CG11_big_fil_rev_8_21_14_0_20_37_9]|nr:MAG: hypothetical protein COV47_05390 [Candidatus Diapherotrites archaeon CG11_big_fil_rev_8_21_14_0_20_37_9]